MEGKDISKFLGLIPHHKSETIRIAVYEHGWAKVDECGRKYLYLDTESLVFT